MIPGGIEAKFPLRDHGRVLLLRLPKDPCQGSKGILSSRHANYLRLTARRRRPLDRRLIENVSHHRND